MGLRDHAGIAMEATIEVRRANRLRRIDRGED